MESKSLNRSLHAAKTAKQDEFYTQYVDIQKEIEGYLEFDPDTFRNKILLIGVIQSWQAKLGSTYLTFLL